MGKFVKGLLIFTGGAIVGGYSVVNAAMKSETFTTALKDAAGKKIVEVLYVSKTKSEAPPYGRIEDLVFESRRDADEVLDAMAALVGKFGLVTLGDAYEIATAGPRTYSMERYGWTSVEEGRVVCNRNGRYVINLPKPEKIK